MFWPRIYVTLARQEGVIGLLDGEGQHEGMAVVGMVVLDRVVAIEYQSGFMPIAAKVKHTDRVYFPIFSFSFFHIAISPARSSSHDF